MTAFAHHAAACALAAAVYLVVSRWRRESRQHTPLPVCMRVVIARQSRCQVEAVWTLPYYADKDLLIRVRATAVNRLDTMQRKGKMPPPKGVTEVLGLEVAGEVVRMGAAAAASGRFRIGDQVLALVAGGGYAEYVAVPTSTVLHKPRELSWEAAASIPEAWLTAFKLLHMVGNVRTGETVLIHAAASGVGLAAVQMAVAAGARVIVTVGSQSKLALCKRLGAAGGAVRHDGPWAASVATLAGEGGVNLVLDCVAGNYAEQNLEVLAIDGRWLLYSALSGPALPPPLGESFLGALMKKRVSLLASTLRTRPEAFKAELVARFGKEVLPRIAGGTFEHVIDRIFQGGLKEAQEAHEYMESNANAGKIVLTNIFEDDMLIELPTGPIPE